MHTQKTYRSECGTQRFASSFSAICKRTSVAAVVKFILLCLWTLATLLWNPKIFVFAVMYVTTSSAYSEAFWCCEASCLFFFGQTWCYVFSCLIWLAVWSAGTCHPRQCSSSDCRGTQLIRHGNDGSMLLTSASFSGGVFPSGFSSSARDTFDLFWARIIKAFIRNLTCFYLADFVGRFCYIFFLLSWVTR